MTKVLKRLQGRFGAAALAGIVALGAGPACASEYEVRMPVEKTARIAPLGEVPGAAPDAKPEAKAPGKPAAKPAAKADAKTDAATKTDAPKAAPKTALGRAAEAAAAAAVPAKVNSPASSSAPAVTPSAAPPAAPKAAKPAAAQAKKNGKAAHSASPQALSADPDASGDTSVTHVPSGPPIPVPVPPAQGPAASAHAPAPAPASALAPVKAPKAAPVVVVDPKASVMPPAASAKPAPTPLPTDGQWVGDVDVEFRADSIVLRAATNGAVERVTWFNLADPGAPRKLAVDLRGAWRKKGGAVSRFDTGPVKNIVAGEHPDRLRLSVEFRDGAVARQGLDPKVENGPQGVSVTIPLAVRLAP